jgi:LuxR family maltose regulon positive regulatory protein
VRVWLAQGNLAAAEHWAQTYDLKWAASLNLLNECAQLARTRVLMARGQVGEAEQLLEQLLASAESGGRMGRVIEILVLQALTADARHDLAGAVVLLNRALALAEPEGYVRLFVDEGVPMASLLDRAAMNRSVRLGYIGKLLAACGPATRFRTSPVDQLSSAVHEAAAIAQPLSQREIEILRRLASGLSAKQIAQELIVSIGTVKTHTKSIYRKLDVHSRLQAVERARELRLI